MAPRDPPTAVKASPRPAPLRGMFDQSWRHAHPLPALYCLPALLALLGAGLAVGQPGAAMVAASGAFSAGFGAFQRVTRVHVAPMILASLCMAIAMAVGTVASNSVYWDALCVGLAAFSVGLGTVFGTGVWWVLLQGAVFIVVAGSMPGDLEEGMQRALLVLGGGLVQSGSIAGLRALFPHGFPPLSSPALVAAPASRAEWLAAVRQVLGHKAPEPRFGLLLGLAAAAAILLQHRLQLPNGYWVAMTVILVLRRGGEETVVRGALRIGGTLLGAGAATLVVALLKPSPGALTVLIALSAWAAYAVQWVNYGTFSATVTSYIAYLFALQGLPETMVAGNRIVATLIGGALALAAFGLAMVWRRALGRALNLAQPGRS